MCSRDRARAEKHGWDKAQTDGIVKRTWMSMWRKICTESGEGMVDGAEGINTAIAGVHAVRAEGNALRGDEEAGGAQGKCSTGESSTADMQRDGGSAAQWRVVRAISDRS